MKKGLKVFLSVLSSFLLLGVLAVPITANEVEQTPVLAVELEDTVQRPQSRRLVGTINVAYAPLFKTSSGLDFHFSIPRGATVTMDSANITNGRINVMYQGTWGWVNVNHVGGIQWQ